MSISESDIELLESHLDGELSAAAESALLLRLSTDHQLAAELKAIRADRAIRLEVFESGEPNDQSVRSLILNVRKQIIKDAVHGDRMRIFRYIATAAACVMISFSAGWLGKGQVGGGLEQVAKGRMGSEKGAPAIESVATNDKPSGSIDFGRQDFNLTNHLVGNSISGFGTNSANNVNSSFGNSFSTDLVSNQVGEQPAMQFRGPDPGMLVFDSHPPRNPDNGSGAYQVNLTDVFGHVIAVQHFNTLKEARDFTEDVNQSQKQQQQMRGAEPVDFKGQF